MCKPDTSADDKTRASKMQSHVDDPQVTQNAPVVPTAIYQDAQDTKTMAARLHRMLKKETKLNVDMQAKVDRLRDYIAKASKDEMDDAKKEDQELVKRKFLCFLRSIGVKKTNAHKVWREYAFMNTHTNTHICLCAYINVHTCTRISV